MTDKKYRWYEPQHALLGSKSYFAHTWGSAYVLSGETAIRTFLPATLAAMTVICLRAGFQSWGSELHRGQNGKLK